MQVGELVVVHFDENDVQVAEVTNVANGSEVEVDNHSLPRRVEWVDKECCEEWPRETLQTLGLI